MAGVKIEDFFCVGARWRHREQKLLVRICSVLEPGKFTLSIAPGNSEATPSEGLRLALSCVWTSEDLLRGFDPVPLGVTRHELLLDGLEE